MKTISEISPRSFNKPETLVKHEYEPKILQGQEPIQVANNFRNLWRNVTDDNYLTLFGFRRFRTSHLLNLRFLEEEIANVDHQIFQAGMKLECPPAPADKLGLKHGKRDPNSPDVDKVIDQALVLRLRDMLKQYDEALLSLNQMMMMETFALADNAQQSHLRNDLHPYETYKTRLLRVDLAPRNGSRDFIRHSLRKCLRAFWFFVRRPRTEANTSTRYSAASGLESNLSKSYQNTTHLAEVITRFLVALLAGVFLVIPMIILSNQSSNEHHLITVSVCIVIFSLLVSLLSKASNEQTMAASAGYAAVLVVFLSNTAAA